MSCNIDRERLRTYALGLCEEKESEEITLHVPTCAACRNELNALERTTAVLAEAFDEDPPDWLAQKTLARIRERQARPFAWGIWGIPVVSGAVIVLLLVLLHPGVRLNNHTYPVAPQARNDKSSIDQPMMSSKKAHLPSLFDGMSDDMTIDRYDPIGDRSIYESLDIAPEVASLLL